MSAINSLINARKQLRERAANTNTVTQTPPAQNIKPTPVKFNFKNIPPIFTNFNNWLLWSYEFKKGRWTKVPYQANGASADSTKPSTWCSFQEVLTAFEKNDRFDGLGFCIGDSGLTCIDFDHSSEHPEHKQIIDKLLPYGYMENSPSGDGSHLWLSVKKPNGKCKSKDFFKSSIEVYNQARFMTFTGNGSTIGSMPFNDCQELFNEIFKDLFFPVQETTQPPARTAQRTISLEDKQIIDLIYQSKQPKRNDFIKWNEYGFSDGEDKSGCDQSFCNILAFYTKDYSQVERIWLSSAIANREKTQQRNDYRQRTIEAALQKVTDSYSPSVTGSEALTQINEQGSKPSESEKVKQDIDLISICEKSPIAEFAASLAKSAQMPRNTTFLTALSMFSAVSSRVYTVSYRDGSTQPTSLYFVGEQPPGTSKSRILNSSKGAVQKTIRDTKKTLSNEIKSLKEKIEDEEDSAEKKALKKRLREVQAEKRALFEFITDATPEAIDMTLQDTNGFFSIISSEQGAINTLLGLTYSDNKNQTNKDLILSGYNGDSVNTKRKGRETYSGRACGSICVLAQEGMIKNILQASGSSGAVERFVLWAEPSLLGKRQFLEYTPLCEFAVNNYDEAILKIYYKIDIQKEYEDLYTLKISARSWHVIDKLKHDIEPTLANGEEHSANLLRGLFAKIDILIMKIASVLHLSIDPNSTLIHDDRVNEAVTIAMAYIEHMKGQIEDSAVTVLNEQEKVVIKYLAKGGKTGKQIVDGLFRRKAFIKGDTANRETVKKCLYSMLAKELVKVDLKNNNKLSEAIFTAV